jgi:hypothetical protein
VRRRRRRSTGRQDERRRDLDRGDVAGRLDPRVALVELGAIGPGVDAQCVGREAEVVADGELRASGDLHAEA